MIKMIVDYETRSRCDLKKAGGFKYSMDPSTEILCVGFKLGDSPAQIWEPETERVPFPFISALKNGVTIVAHNANFERYITENVLTRYLDFDPTKITWKCTAAKAAAHALPRSLEGACLALGLPVQKDMEGRRLVLKYCKPRKATLTNKAEWHYDRKELKKIFDYCLTDVEAEAHLENRLPDLTPKEAALWELDAQINKRGIAVDLSLIHSVQALALAETENLKIELTRATGGLVTSATQRAGLLAYLEFEGVSLDNTQKKTIEDEIKAGKLPPEILKVLKLKQSLSLTSIAKYEAFLGREINGRVHDLLIYHGASTGRWSGSGVQPQNFPKGTIADTDEAVRVIKFNDLELIRDFYGDPMPVFSSVIRGVLKASEGRELFCADFAAIEARVLFWCVGETKGLSAFYEGRDLYKEMAAVIYKKKAEDITKNERQLGKAAVLGCGYGMGKRKFFDTCLSWGIAVSEEMASLAVDSYRKSFFNVPQAWRNYERAAIEAVRLKGRAVKIMKTTWLFKDNFLYCILPSGRRLAYYGAEVKREATPWGMGEKLYHWATNPVTKKWEFGGTYGGLLTENVVQAISRDLMAEAITRLTASGYPVLLSVHDEVISEAPIGKGDVKEFEKLMATVPDWAKGCPIEAEGWKGERYRK